MVSRETPLDFEDGVIEIRSPKGTKRITPARLAEITFEAAKDQKHFDRLIDEEVAPNGKSGEEAIKELR
jgi:hypothetical protein